MDEQIYNSISITGTAATITSLLGVSSPESAAAPIDIVLKKAKRHFPVKKQIRL